MNTKDSQEVVEEMEKRLAETARKRDFYFYAAWPLLALGVALLLSKATEKFGFALIITGVIGRILYYRARRNHIALSRYIRELGGKSLTGAIISALLLAAAPDLRAQLSRGDKAPSLSELSPVNDRYPESLAGNRKNTLKVLEFWATWDKTSKLTFNLLSEIQDSLPVENVVFIQISKESAATVRKFLETLTVKPTCAVCVDPKGTVSDAFLGEGAGIPQVFIIGADGVIIWKGEVVDLRYVLGKIVSGDFDPDVQLKIIPLRKRLQRSMQLARYVEAKQLIDKILRMDPADELAARVRLFFFERDKKMDEAVGFIDSLLSRSPKTPFLHLLKLDAMNESGAPAVEIRSAAERALAAMGDTPAYLNALAELLVNRLRFGAAPLDIALKASSKAVDLFFAKQPKNPARLARYLATRAKIRYLLGDFDDAVEDQEHAVRLLKGDPVEKKAEELLNYYKSVKKLAAQSQ